MYSLEIFEARPQKLDFRSASQGKDQLRCVCVYYARQHFFLKVFLDTYEVNNDYFFQIFRDRLKMSVQ